MAFLDVVLLILLSALWGASYLFMRVAGPSLGPIVLMALRVSIGAGVLLAYVGAVRQMPDLRARWRQYLMLGALHNAIPFTLIANAVIHLNASMAAILNATTPMCTAIVAAIWIREPFGLRKALGTALGIGGVVILMGWSPLPLTATTIFAVAQASLASLAYGMAAVYARRRFAGVSPLHTAVGQLCGSSALLLPLALAMPPTRLPAWPVILSVLGLAVACTAFAYLLYFRLIAVAGPTKASTVTILTPFFSVLWGVVFLHEPLNLGMFAGLGVTLVSVWLVLSARG